MVHTAVPRTTRTHSSPQPSQPLPHEHALPIPTSAGEEVAVLVKGDAHHAVGRVERLLQQHSGSTTSENERKVSEIGGWYASAASETRENM